MCVSKHTCLHRWVCYAVTCTSTLAGGGPTQHSCGYSLMIQPIQGGKHIVTDKLISFFLECTTYDPLVKTCRGPSGEGRWLNRPWLVIGFKSPNKALCPTRPAAQGLGWGPEGFWFDPQLRIWKLELIMIILYAYRWVSWGHFLMCNGNQWAVWWSGSRRGAGTFLEHCQVSLSKVPNPHMIRAQLLSLIQLPQWLFMFINACNRKNLSLWD